MNDLSWLSRTKLLIGDEKLAKLQQAHVLIIGMGGVGSFAAEFICRAGVGTITIVDGDTVDPTNRNRQLPALATNHGLYKVDIMRERMLQINPALQLHTIKKFVGPEQVNELLAVNYDYVIDAIDSVTPKINFIRVALERNLRIVSAMGAGGKMDPTQLKIVDISKTHTCPFAQYIRKRLKEYAIYKGFKAVFSTETNVKESLLLTDGSNFKKSAYGTMSYMPAAFGGACASVAIRDLMLL